nr:reverse transcriptase domain-containing protein [Tanacetum cinerariifolium]
ITTRSGLVIDGPTVPTPSQSINPEEDERVEETFTDPDLAEYTIKKLGLPKLIPTRMTLELANRAICTPAGIATDVFISVGKFTCPADFVIVDYESDPRVPLILERPFLRTARALIDVYGEEMILRDGDERLTLNMRHDTSSYSKQPQKESINLINVFNNSSADFLEDLFSYHPEGCNILSEKLPDLDSTKDLHPPLHDNPLSGSTTYPLLEEFANELPSEYDDNLYLKDSIDQKNRVNLADIFVDSIPEMFTDKHTLDYSSPLIFDVYADDFLEVESDAENIYNDPFDSKGEKIKESKLLIDELDLPCDFHPPSEYDSFISQDFFRVDALPSTNNEDKIFNPGILIQENPVEIITRVVQDKKLAISNASLVFEDFDPPFYEPLFFKEVPKTMDMTIDQQVVLDEAIVPHESRLRIRKSNFRLKSDISSKESTLQLAYDEFWATAMVHHHSIRFKMDNKKHIVILEYFREMLHICLRLPGQTFDELPFEEEILAFFRFLGHIGEIRKLIDVNINKLHQPWRSFAAIINKCLSGKSTGYDSLRLSQAQMLWGLYHKRNVDFAYLMWEDFVYQVEHKDANKSNEMYYPRFTKVIVHYFMSKDPLILRRNRVNWHYVKDDKMFTTIKLTKAIVRKTKSSSDTTVTPPPTAAAGTRLSTSAKGKQPAKASKAKSADEGTGTIPGVPDVPTEESDEEISWKSSDEGDDDDDDDQDEGDDDDDQEKGNDNDQDSDEEDEEFIHPKLSIHDEEETSDEESFDPIPKMPENSDDEGNDEENLGLNVGRDEGQDEEDDEYELYRDVNINLEGRVVQMADVHTTQEFKDSHVTLTLASTTVAPLPLSAPTLTPSTIATISTVPQAPTPPTTAPSTLLRDLLNSGSLFGFDYRLKTLEASFSEFVKVQVSKILPKIEQTVNEQLEAKVLTQSSNSSKTSYAVADDLSQMELKKILIEKMKGNKSIHQFNDQRNLYKALVEAYESDKIILDTCGDTVTLKRRRNDEADKDEEPSTGSDRGSKRRREGNEPESASAPKEKATRTTGKSTQGSKSQQTSASESATAKEPMQTTHEMEEPSHPEFETGADDQPIPEPFQHPEWFSQQKKPPTPDRDWNKTLPATHRSIQPWISELAKQTGYRSSFNELMDTLVDFSAFLMNRLKVDTLTPELLAGPTYELMKGSCKSLVELELFLEEVYKATTDQLDWINPEGQQYPHNLLKPLPLIPNSRGRYVILFDYFINNDLEYLRGCASSRKYTTSVTKIKAADYGHIKWVKDLVPRTMWIQEPVGYDKHALWGISHWGRKRQQFYEFAVNKESARDVYSKGRIIAVTEFKINVYKKHHNPKANLTRPDTYRSDLKRKEAYTAYSNPRGFIYQNKDKQNRLMQIDELHKFSDGTLTDIRTALDDHLKGIRMKYLPQTIWRKSDKERAAAMI